MKLCRDAPSHFLTCKAWLCYLLLFKWNRWFSSSSIQISVILACPWNRILFVYLDLWIFLASYNNWIVVRPTFYPFTIKIKYLYASVCCGSHLGLSQDGRCLGLNSSVEPQASSSQNSITRKAGGRKENEKGMQVSVFLLPLWSLTLSLSRYAY